METFSEDVQHISDAANLDLKQEHRNSVSHKNSSKPSTEQRTKLYFSQMPKDLVNKLYQMYKIDFDMFDYDPWKYNSQI